LWEGIKGRGNLLGYIITLTPTLSHHGRGKIEKFLALFLGHNPYLDKM